MVESRSDTAEGRDWLRVEVAHARPDNQVLLVLEVPPGTTVIEAIRRSRIENQFADLDIRSDRLGIFSRKVGPEEVLRDGDRVEIYRPLLADPREARRRRARGEGGPDESP